MIIATTTTPTATTVYNVARPMENSTVNHANTSIVTVTMSNHTIPHRSPQFHCHATEMPTLRRRRHSRRQGSTPNTSPRPSSRAEAPRPLCRRHRSCSTPDTPSRAYPSAPSYCASGSKHFGSSTVRPNCCSSERLPTTKIG